MTFSGLFAIGLSGVSAFSASIEAVSANIANSQTAGYKRARIDFSDLVTTDAADSASRIGAGVAPSTRQLVAEQGSLARTGAATNVAIAGAGFFVVAPETGAGAGAVPLYTRSGDFTPNAAGDLVNGAGYFLRGYAVSGDGASGALQTVNVFREPVRPAGSPPLGALVSVEIDAEGRLLASYANGEKHALFQIPVALFVNADGLERVDGTAFRATAESGVAALGLARQGRAGAIEGSALEFSTVDIGREFGTLIETQRAYSANARVISAADELWRKLVETAA